MFAVNIVPGQGFHKLTIWRKEGSMNSAGRPVQGKYFNTGLYILGMVTSAPQREINEWKQNGHPISHEIIEYGAVEQAKATDYLVSEDGHYYYIQGKKDPAGLQVSILYYAEERAGVDGAALGRSEGSDPQHR